MSWPKQFRRLKVLGDGRLSATVSTEGDCGDALVERVAETMGPWRDPPRTPTSPDPSSHERPPGHRRPQGACDGLHHDDEPVGCMLPP